MELETLRAKWVEAAECQPCPSARCGHVAVAVASEAWGGELLVVHGGIDRSKEALGDLAVLQCEQRAWFQPEARDVGPAARAFHAAAAVGRRVYIFGGHVFVKQQHKLHQFNDVWCLDTDSWEWGRADVAPDAAQPCPRDRASMTALPGGRLLVYGGADSQNKRLDDAWVFDPETSSWAEVAVTGAKPRARCCAVLAPLERRVLLFGGDAYGPTAELWSLRGLGEGEGPPQWTQLSLQGPQPAARRGHAVTATGHWVVFMGGLTEQRSMLGIKSRSDYLNDVLVLDRSADKVAWRGVEAEGGGSGVVGVAVPQPPRPAPREKHTLTALSGGRMLLFGGTDGQTTLGDAWWLELEDMMGPSSPPQGHLPLPPKGAASGLDAAVAVAAAAAAAPAPAAIPPAAPAGGGLSGYFPSLPTSLPALPALSAMPQGLTTAFSSLRDRLGLPAAASSAAPALPAADGGAESDQALLHLGERVLAREGLPGPPPNTAQLVAAARRRLSTAAPEELALGELPALLSDYRRLARLGWAALLAERGPEALLAPDGAAPPMPGRYMHLQYGDLRMREVGEVLADYRLLLGAAGPGRGW